MKGILLAFRVFKNTDAKTTNLFCQKFYGQDTSSHGGKYHHHKRGLLEDIPHVKLIRGVIMLLEKDAEKVIEFLKEFNAEVHVRELVLTPGDEKVLRRKD
ncbi:MAG: hypothetical protein HY929_06400 [Euryarchaeota archaeon]|nr:hypothetical protein [Euryarchaeota archaeon]